MRVDGPSIMFYSTLRPGIESVLFRRRKYRDNIDASLISSISAPRSGDHPLFVKSYLTVDEFEQMVRENLQERVFEFAARGNAY